MGPASMAFPQLSVVALFVSKTFFYIVLTAHVLHYRIKLKGGRFERYALLPIFNAVRGGSHSFKAGGHAAGESCDDCQEDATNHDGKYTTYEDALADNQKYIGWIHGAVVFLSLLLPYPDQASQGDTPLRYLVGIVLTYFIYDGGAVHKEEYWFAFCLNNHHLGVVIALLYQGANAASDWQNLCLFTHLWSIHSFGFVQDIILPLFGIEKVKEGKKSHFMEAVRYVYSLASVYHFYWYVNAPGQPTMGLNYQTAALATMVAGRFLCNNNFKNVDFIRRVELPGFAWVMMHYFVFSGSALKAGLSTIFVYAIIIACLVMMPRNPKPENLVLTDEVKEFLSQKWEKRQELFATPKDDMLQKVRGWWKGMSFAEKWPLHDAVIRGDTDRIEELLKLTETKEETKRNVSDLSPDSKIGGIAPVLDVPSAEAGVLRHRGTRGDEHPASPADPASGSTGDKTIDKSSDLVNVAMTDWHECTPLHFACHLGDASIVLMLMRQGGNPWAPIMGGMMDGVALAKNQGHADLLAFFCELEGPAFRALNIDAKTLERMKFPPLWKKLRDIV